MSSLRPFIVVCATKRENKEAGGTESSFRATQASPREAHRTRARNTSRALIERLIRRAEKKKMGIPSKALKEELAAVSEPIRVERLLSLLP